MAESVTAGGSLGLTTAVVKSDYAQSGWRIGVQSQPFLKWQTRKRETRMNWKSRLVLGVLTALAMMLATFFLPRGGALRDASLVQFPTTIGVWAIFVLLFVKLK